MISLTVPIYNEEGSIEPLFEKVRAVMDPYGQPWEIIFVNDGASTVAPRSSIASPPVVPRSRSSISAAISARPQP